MQNEYEADIIGLVDEEGNEYKFEILDRIEEDGRTFYALIPSPDDVTGDVEDTGEYYIMEEIMEDGEDAPVLADIDDEELLDRLAETFESHFDEMFEFDEEEDEE